MNRWRLAVLALVGLPAAALLAMWLGVYNVAASTGHWAITEWVLHFAMRSSVRTYALGVETPPLDDPHLLPAAAGHYERGCAGCHGAPDRPRPPNALAMLPQPPDLQSVVPSWDDAELFRIVKHGVRFTGMPAWPALSRDDEVWAMVAFLRALPGMDADAYRALAFGPAAGRSARPGDAFGEALAGCARCHGYDGRGRGALVPVLAGQKEAYLRNSLAAFAGGRRASGIMALAAAETDPALWDDLARHFAAATPAASAVAAAAGDPARGREIARRGIPERKVPACLGCHGDGRSAAYPRLDGQPARYLEAQLRLFASGARGGSAYRHLMDPVAQGLTPQDIRDVAAYFASRPAGAR